MLKTLVGTRLAGECTRYVPSVLDKTQLANSFAEIWNPQDRRGRRVQCLHKADHHKALNQRLVGLTDYSLTGSPSVSIALSPVLLMKRFTDAVRKSRQRDAKQASPSGCCVVGEISAHEAFGGFRVKAIKSSEVHQGER